MKGVVSKLKRHNIKKDKAFKEAQVQRNINHIKNQTKQKDQAPPHFSKN